MWICGYGYTWLAGRDMTSSNERCMHKQYGSLPRFVHFSASIYMVNSYCIVVFV